MAARTFGSTRPRFANEEFFVGKVLQTAAGDVQVTSQLAKQIYPRLDATTEAQLATGDSFDSPLISTNQLRALATNPAFAEVPWP